MRIPTRLAHPTVLTLLTLLTFQWLTTEKGTAQDYSVVHSFEGSDVCGPDAGLVLSGTTLYGTTSDAACGFGAVFKLNTDGTGFTVLHNFNRTDGARPHGYLVLSGNTLYGTTSWGGTGALEDGTVFKVNTDGTGFSVLFNFEAIYGSTPVAGLVLSGNTLYGTTWGGGNSWGTAFKINTDGTGFSVLHKFVGSDGEGPSAGVLLLSGNTLYGAARSGGYKANGTVFKLHTDGTGFSVLHYFTGSDGSGPDEGLLLSGNTLYGTTFEGGAGQSGTGTAFKLNTDGAGFSVIYDFSSMGGGESPRGRMILSGDTLYGTTTVGRTLYKLNTDGSGFTTLYYFSNAEPGGGMVLSGNTLYGTDNSLFAFTLLPAPIPINFYFGGGTVLLSWGNPVFSLQAAPTVIGAYTNVPGATSPYTNPITSPQQYFRLKAN